MRDGCNGIIDHIHIIAFANPLIKSNIQQLRNNSLTQSDPPTTSHYYFNQDEKFFWLWLPNEEALHRIQRQHPPAACESFRKYDELLLGRIARIRAWLLPFCRHNASVFVQVLISKPLRDGTTNVQSGMGIWRTLEEPMRQQSIVARRLLLLRVRQQRRLVAANSFVWSRPQRGLGLFCRYSLEIGGIILDMPQKRIPWLRLSRPSQRESIDRRILLRGQRAARHIKSSGVLPQ